LTRDLRWYTVMIVDCLYMGAKRKIRSVQFCSKQICQPNN